MATPGIDVGWIGHYDLTNALGIDGQFDHPRYKAAVKALVRACERNNKAAGFLCGDVKTGRRYLDWGFRVLCLRHRHRRVSGRAQGRHRRAARAQRLIADQTTRVIRLGAIRTISGQERQTGGDTMTSYGAISRGGLRRVARAGARLADGGRAGARPHPEGQEDPHHRRGDVAAVRHSRQGQQADRLGGRDRAPARQGSRRRARARAGHRPAAHSGAAVGPRRPRDLVAFDHHGSREVRVVLQPARRALASSSAAARTSTSRAPPTSPARRSA